MVVVRDDQGSLAVNGAFEDAVVIRIGGNEVKAGLRDDHVRNLCDQAECAAEGRPRANQNPAAALRRSP